MKYVMKRLREKKTAVDFVIDNQPVRPVKLCLQNIDAGHCVANSVHNIDGVECFCFVRNLSY